MEIKLDAKQVLEKEFGTSLRGYSKEEVDNFLDQIIKDYEAFRYQLDEAEAKYKQLQQEMEKLRTERPTAQRSAVQSKAPQQVKQPPAGTTNFDILKRLSNLERHVFGDKLNNEEL